MILKKIRKSAIGSTSEEKKPLGSETTRKVFGGGVDQTIHLPNHPVNQLIAKITKGGL
jgi:hypothetical protein